MELLLFFFFFFFLFSLVPLSSTQANDTTLPGSIARTTMQQLLATLSPGNPSASEPFLSSPSGKYAAYFLRHVTAPVPIPDAGGFGTDFCYIQVAEINTTDSRWESDCVPVSISNGCSLIFSDSGLEILDGSNSAWSTGAQTEYPPQNLELDDEGDMTITGEGGELAWKASSDEPRQNQHCGELGLPGLTAAAPPSTQSIGKGSEIPLGQPPSGRSIGRVGPMPEVGNGAGIGYGGLPLVDSTPYDSGSLKPVERWVGMGRAWLLCLTAFGGVLF
ncbi:hypothetical protein IEQ34_018439 [Dendrobium chrysotoxum]|uniref:Uncharacterized protein n=1 Tax=Dendrobium chrysotoxum TaxID=161865 RepID=A0AAV7FND8_DENCH|nr:hypothetical protein IEQ34_018439 [Dendrobium chrysotoxum]